MKEEKVSPFSTVKIGFPISKIKIEVPFEEVMCPIGKDLFRGVIEVRLEFNKKEPSCHVPEYISFTRWAQSFEEETIESLVNKIFKGTNKMVESSFLEVIVRAKSPTHAPVTATIQS